MGGSDGRTVCGQYIRFSSVESCKAFTRFQASILSSDKSLRKGAKAPQLGFFDACDELVGCFKDLDQVYENQYATWRRNLFDYVTNELPRRKEERH